MSLVASGSCDNRCTSGKEGTCRCSCGGANHGTAKQIWDIIQDGGNANVKGKGLDLHLSLADDNGRVQVWQRGNKVQQYKSEEEFVKDLGKLIRAGQVDVDAFDAYSKRQVNLPADPERSNREKKLTDKEAQKQIRETGATVSRKDGEYRVNVPGGTEGTAYYTDDAKDAVGTAKHMMDTYKRLGGVPDGNSRRTRSEDAGGSFSHAGLFARRGSIEADEAATYAWAHRSGSAWPGSTISGHKISAGFDRNGNLVDLVVDDGKTDIDTLDGNEVNAFLDDVHPRED